VSAEELAPSLDAVFITHEHGDHFREATAAVLIKS
jgi:L-ascorbate metabolism protein UlaG (beta-lactamase superfamily)